jgi:hypothetical protein
MRSDCSLGGTIKDREAKYLFKTANGVADTLMRGIAVASCPIDRLGFAYFYNLSQLIYTHNPSLS